MFVTARRKMRSNHKYWHSIETMGLGDRTEIRTVNYFFNNYATGGDFQCTPDTFDEACSFLLPLEAEDEYYMLAVNLSIDPHFHPFGWHFLGYDIADKYHMSMLFDCPPWDGKLAPIHARRNQYGLLSSMEDAKLAQKLFPGCWGEINENIDVPIWALYEKKLDSASASMRPA